MIHASCNWGLTFGFERFRAAIRIKRTTGVAQLAHGKPGHVEACPGCRIAQSSSDKYAATVIWLLPGPSLWWSPFIRETAKILSSASGKLEICGFSYFTSITSFLV
jgi:hypothetical protein